MTNWSGPPAVGTVLARLVSLAARVERLRLEKQRQRVERMLTLAGKKDTR